MSYVGNIGKTVVLKADGEDAQTAVVVSERVVLVGNPPVEGLELILQWPTELRTAHHSDEVTDA